MEAFLRVVNSKQQLRKRMQKVRKIQVATYSTKLQHNKFALHSFVQVKELALPGLFVILSLEYCQFIVNVASFKLQ